MKLFCHNSSPFPRIYDGRPIILFGILLLLFSCSIEQKQNWLEEVKYTIDLDGKNETSIPVSSIFKNVQTIVLETNEECLIGRIHEAQVFDNYIYIYLMLSLQKVYLYYIQYHNDRLYVSVISWEPSKDDYMLVEADPNNGKIISQSLPLELNKEWAKPHFTGHSFFISRLSPPKFTNLFMDYIMSLDETITPYIELKSRNLVTSRDLKELPDGQSLQDMIPSSFQKIWDIHSFVENNAFIIFNYRIGLSVFKTLVYNKETGLVKIVDYLSNDLIYRKNEENQFGRIIFSDSKGAYEVLSSNMLEKLKESIRRNEVVPNLDKKDELLKLNEQSNPIIFFYEFKSLVSTKN